MEQAKIRLYVDQPLAAGQPVAVGEGQANYLFNVMRLAPGAPVAVFNGHDGEWLARVEQAGKRAGILRAEAQVAPLRAPPDLWLLFAPIKKARTDFVVEKAVELGVARILPVLTRRTQGDRIRQDKMRAHAIEAAEQCGATVVPDVVEAQPLDRLLASWPTGRRILWADEGLAGTAATFAGLPPGPWAILIGPEGGFAPDERASLQALPQILAASLGPRILRAETAAVAAITLWQAHLGDWK
jgi:16S rRNA (uracil1498-N3)-methyltransferase